MFKQILGDNEFVFGKNFNFDLLIMNITEDIMPYLKDNYLDVMETFVTSLKDKNAIFKVKDVKSLFVLHSVVEDKDEYEVIASIYFEFEYPKQVFTIAGKIYHINTKKYIDFDISYRTSEITSRVMIRDPFGMQHVKYNLKTNSREAYFEKYW
jgi:hypothetical protein